MTSTASHLKSNWSFPTQVLFGPGRIASLARACKALNMHRPLLVTDPTLAKLDIVQEALAANLHAGVPTEIFSEVKPNPVGQNVLDGVRQYRDGGHDGVIAFGGGSALDCGKAIAFMAGQTRPIWDFEDRGDNWKLADPAGIAPIIAVPTTAGTGSETGRAGVILDESDNTKKIIFHPKMLPSTVISDPELTLGLPTNVTAATGMDALAHCLEAYCAPGFQPLCDGIAVEGLRLIKVWLPVAVKDGSNVEARANMLAAASMGSTAFQKGLGAIHALSHPVGALYDSHHGLTNAVFMPYVLAFNREAIAEKMVRLAAWLDLPSHDFDGVMDWILDLRVELEIPHALTALGVEEARLDQLAEMAAVDPAGGGNPVPLTVANLRSLLDKAMSGEV